LAWFLGDFWQNPRFYNAFFFANQSYEFEVICSYHPHSCGRLNLPTLATLFLQRKAMIEIARWKKLPGLIGAGSGYIPNAAIAADDLIPASSLCTTLAAAGGWSLQFAISAAAGSCTSRLSYMARSHRTSDRPRFYLLSQPVAASRSQPSPRLTGYGSGISARRIALSSLPAAAVDSTLTYHVV
jgi:hypothetical protein